MFWPWLQLVTAFMFASTLLHSWKEVWSKLSSFKFSRSLLSHTEHQKAWKDLKKNKKPLSIFRSMKSTFTWALYSCTVTPLTNAHTILPNNTKPMSHYLLIYSHIIYSCPATPITFKQVTRLSCHFGKHNPSQRKVYIDCFSSLLFTESPWTASALTPAV